MEKTPIYIERLLKIKEIIQYETDSKENKLSTYKSFNDNLNTLLREYEISNDFRCEKDKVNVSYSNHIEIFLSALIISINIAKTYKYKNITPIDNNLFKNRLAGSRKIAFIHSKFYTLLVNNSNKPDNYSGKKKSTHQKRYMLDVKLRNMPIKCNELLKPLCSAIICNILNYPYALPLSHYFETNEYKKREIQINSLKRLIPKLK